MDSITTYETFRFRENAVDWGDDPRRLTCELLHSVSCSQPPCHDLVSLTGGGGGISAVGVSGTSLGSATYVSQAGLAAREVFI